MTRVDLPSLYPPFEKETAEAWTNRLLELAQEYRTNRQCSINWHEECSERGDGENAGCQCLCHDPEIGVWSVEGHPEGDQQIITRVVQGKVMMPPQVGEPEGTWAEWLLARSEPDAVERATAFMKRKTTTNA